jgi:hypothetical protein
MDGYGDVAVIADRALAVVVELLEGALVEVWAYRLIHELNGCSYVGSTGVAFYEILESG